MFTLVKSGSVEVVVYPGSILRPVEEKVLKVLGLRGVVDEGDRGVEFKLVPGMIPVAEVPVTLDIGRRGRFTFGMVRSRVLNLKNANGDEVRIRACGG